MAVSFPNFLAAPIIRPDYSGIGNAVNNFYKGYDMPKDALLKEIQAKFAEPTAKANLKSADLRNAYQEILNQYAPSEREQSLKTGDLNNKKSQMQLDQIALALQQDKALQEQFQRALGGQGNVPQQEAMAQQQSGMPQSMVPNAPLMPQFQQGQRPLPGMPQGLPIQPQVPGMTMAAPGMVSPPMGALSQTGAPASSTSPEEVVTKKGLPHLAGIDQMYDSNPLSRAFLEKRGYKKTQETKLDNKTGKITTITTYPSGKVTSSSVIPDQSSNTSDGIPLTNKVLNSAVSQVRGIDAVMPYIDKLIAMGEKDELPISHSGWWNPLSFTDAQASYHGLLSEALDKYMNATGLNITDKSLDTVREILQRRGGESTKHYIQRLKDAKLGKIKDRKMNVSMIQKGLKKNPNFMTDSSDNKSYSSNEWEAI